MDVKSYHHYRSPHQKHKLNGTKKGLKFSYKNLIFNPFALLTGHLSNQFWEDLEEMYKLKKIH